jgi:hypothetical protein
MKKLVTVLMCLNFILTPVAPIMAKDDKSSSEKPGGGAFYANQILSIGTAALGSNILLSCKLGSMFPSLQIFMTGSVAYIASEFMGAKAQQAFLKASTEEVEKFKKTMNEGGDLQREIIEIKLKEEKDKLGFVKKRKTWMMAITAIYTAATVAAYMEMTKLAACEAATGGACSALRIAGCTPEGAASAGLITKGLTAAYAFGVGSSGGGPISTYGGMGVALASLVPAIGAKIVTFYQTPMNRAITFGAAAALSAGVMLGLGGAEKKITSNIKDLEKLLADFKQKTYDENGNLLGGSEADHGSQYDQDKSKQYDIKTLNGQQLAKHCWQNTSQGMNYGEDACKVSTKLNRPKFDMKMNLPTLASVGNSATDLGQAVSDGDMGKADIEAGKLAANAMRMNQIKENIQKQMNDQRKARGEKPIDFKAEEDKKIASMMTDLNKQSAGADAPALASTGNKASLDSLEKNNRNNQSSSTTTSTNTSTAGAPSSNFKFDEGASDEGVATANYQEPTNLPESLDDFEINAGDISKKSEVSIFKQLSNRYLLNYTKIFEKKKKLEDTSTP